MRNFLDLVRAAAAKAKDESSLSSPGTSEPSSEMAEAGEEDSQWQPYKPHKKKCRAKDHWPMIGKCSKCGDVFPCPSGNCGHFDCANPSLAGLDCPGNGTAVPELINVVDCEEIGRAHV